MKRWVPIVVVVLAVACADSEPTDALADERDTADTTVPSAPTTASTSTTSSTTTSTTTTTVAEVEEWEGCEPVLVTVFTEVFGDPLEIDAGRRDGLDGRRLTCSFRYEAGRYFVETYDRVSDLTATEIRDEDTLGRYREAEILELDGHDVMFNPNDRSNPAAEVVCAGGHRFSLWPTLTIDADPDAFEAVFSVERQAALIPVLVDAACARLIELRG